MPTLSDFIKSGSTSTGGWCRPTHRVTCCLFVSGGNSCCICIPQTATCFVVEMWGQGGGSAGSCCCMWNCVGGFGGDYGWYVCTTSNTNHILCVCVCQCQCCFSGNPGHPGQFARVSNCTTGLNYCVLGGRGGCSVCNWGLSTTCQVCNRDYNTCRLANNPVSGVTVSTLNWCCNNPNGTTPNAAIYTQTVGSIGGGLDATIFPPVSCPCFNFYRNGSRGWSDPQAYPFFTTTCGCYWFGVGGASYAGADQQMFKSVPPTDGNYCGLNGNFPGGGASGSGSPGGSCCQGGSGGDGLVLISWS